MQMWVKPGSDVQELVELNIFGNYDVAGPEYGDCWCLCDGNDVTQINVTGSVSGKGAPAHLCLGDGADQCSQMGLTCDGNLTTRWEYNSTYDGAVWDDSDTGTSSDTGSYSDTGNHSDYGDCWCVCDGNDLSLIHI